MEFENQQHHQPHQLDAGDDGGEEEEEDDEETFLPPTHTHTDSPAATHPPRKTKYKECLKNHAVAIGGHAVDGCGEFIPAGDDGTLESLKCAACDCHRNFHRRAGATSTQPFPFPFPFHHHHRPQFGYLQTAAAQPRLLALPSSSGGGGYADLEENYYYSKSNPGKKRFRTKFTAEQKMKMGELAGRLGWRMQKQDEDMVEHFSNEIGITRQVLKVWMHNNKNTLGKKTGTDAAAAVDGSNNE